MPASRARSRVLGAGGKRCSTSCSDRPIAEHERFDREREDALADPSAAEDSVLEFYDDDVVSVGLVALPYKNQSTCPVGAANQVYPKATPPSSNALLWQVVPLSADYRLGTGNLDTGSTLVSRVMCLQRAGSITVSLVSGRGHELR
jgi:hypothetical protein